MASNDTLNNRLHTWKAETTPTGQHLDDASLYRLTAEDALGHASKEDLQHLSLCPTCLAEWANWRKARSAAEEISTDETASVDLSYGFLQAAADGQMSAEQLRSQCGRFALNILPQLNDSSRGMITLELLDDKQAPLENAHVTVRDRNGEILLKGSLQNGRLARSCDHLAEIDLSTWSIVIEQSPKQ